MSKHEPWADRWTIEEKLSRGGQGSTKLVSAIGESTRRAVLKVLNNQTSPQARSRMRREVVALDTLSKGGIKVPAVIESNTDEYANLEVPLYFVMEYVPGKTLADEILARQKLGLEVSVAIALDLCRTVSKAHKENVLHRDLKPANIIVRDFDQADLVIVDYGLSFNDADQNETVTQTGEALRNELLALPETNTLGGDRRDKRSDVTALGAILYYCLTKHAPGHLRDGKGLAPHRRRGFSVHEALAGDARCEKVEALLDRAFSLELENRFQTCEELESRLLSVTVPPSAEESPVDVAQAMAKILRQADRKLLLTEYDAKAHQFMAALQMTVQRLGELPPFQIGMAHVGLAEGVLPDGLDRLAHALGIAVNLRSHQVTRAIVFQLAAKGSQCVLLRHSAAAAFQNYPELRRGVRWEEVYWFDPTAEFKPESLQPFVHQSVNEAMRAIKDDVLGQQEKAAIASGT